MPNIAKRLASYMNKHAINLIDTDCETILAQLYQSYAESYEFTPRSSTMDSKNWMTSWEHLRLPEGTA